MYVKVKSGGQIFLVKICDPEYGDFTSNGIVVSILEKLNLDTEDRGLIFKDRDGAQINFEDLPEVILQYRCCNCFFIEFCLEGKASSTSSKKNFKKELECYLKNGDFSAMFNEYSRKQTLSDSSRRSLVRESINFLRQRSGNYPNREDKTALAEAIIHLFPAYKVENSNCGGTDLFFNPVANSGYLVAKLKNINSKRRKLSTVLVKQENDKEDGGSSGSEDDNISQEDLNFFQNSLLAAQLPTIKEKLKQTLKARIKYCTAADVNVLQTFPIFAFDSSLILFDFELRYGKLKGNALLNNWENYNKFVIEIVNETGVQNMEGLADWSSEILQFLYLLTLLPSTSAGPGREKRAKIHASVDSFITFEELETPIDKYKIGSGKPTIIAVGANKSYISKYLISCDGKYINLPIDFKFIQVFDLYFKSFEIFNIEFDTTLAPFLRFFAKFIYNIDKKKTPSTRLVEINSKFQNKFKTLTNIYTETIQNIKIEEVREFARE